jgi:uncharacterized protein (DUF2062 family)
MMACIPRFLFGRSLLSVLSVANPSSTSSRPFWRRRLTDPIKAQLTQGITPDKIALTIAIGVVCGIFPFLGFATLLCFVVAWMLRLNQPIIHIVNQLLWPVHLLCIPLFVRLGEVIYGEAKTAFSLRQFMRQLYEDWWPHPGRHEHRSHQVLYQMVEDWWHHPIDFLDRFGRIGLHTLTAWAVTTPVIIAVIYFILRPFLRTVTAVVKTPVSPKPTGLGGN